MDETIRVDQNVILENRKKLTLTGIKNVISFDDETLILDSALGNLTVKGNDIHIQSFDNESGDLSATGKITAFVYTSEEGGGNFFSRLFR